MKLTDAEREALRTIYSDYRDRGWIDGADAVVSLVRAALAAVPSLAGEREALSFAGLRAVNVARCNRWHPPTGLESWSVSDWAVAMAGEAGEVCNAVKKLRRVEDEITNLNEGDRQLDTKSKAIAVIGPELADTLLYLDLLAARLGIDLESEVVAKFNAVSERYGFPERLPAPAPPPPEEGT